MKDHLGAMNIDRGKQQTRTPYPKLVILLLFVLIATSSFGCQGKSPKALELEQYLDNNLGVKLEHPTEWTRRSGRTFEEQSTSFMEGDLGDVEAAIVVLKSIDTTETPLGDVVQEKKSSLIEDGAEEMQQREVSLGGELAYELSYYEHTFQNISTIQIKNGYVFELLCYVRFYAYQNYEPMFREVIESFSYLEPATNDNRGS